MYYYGAPGARPDKRFADIAILSPRAIVERMDSG